MRRSYTRKIEEFKVGDIVRHYYINTSTWFVIAELQVVIPGFEYAYCYEIGSIHTFYRHTIHINNLIKQEEDENA
jgi:hypothetical protein